MNILVFGDIILDINLYGTSNRLAPEAPIPVVNINNIDYVIGGAGNVASNLTSLGCNVYVCSVVGNDENGKIVKDKMQKNTKDCFIFVENNEKTSSKYRTFIGKNLHARYDIETVDEICQNTQKNIYEQIEKMIDKFDGVIISDYMKGVVAFDLCQNIINLFNLNKKPIFVDPKDKNYAKYKNCTFIKPNRPESENIINIKTSIENSEKCLKLIKEKINCESCMITFSEDGLCIDDRNNRYYHINIENKKEVIDVTGAGDTVMAAYVFKYLKTKDELLSAKFANYCGQIKITHIGVYSITLSDEIGFIKNNNKLINRTDLDNLLISLKNKKIVFTNGCFDILHYGHISYLQKAKMLGDILIVGLNSDSSIKMNKGENRPYNKELYRIEQLKALECVDFVIVFDEKTPTELLKTINPDLYVKGGDYKVEDLIGKEYAKQTLCLNYVNGISSTKLINDSNEKKDHL